jgi:TonB family protein
VSLLSDSSPEGSATDRPVKRRKADGTRFAATERAAAEDAECAETSQLQKQEASDVFSAPEIARAAGVRTRDVRNLVRSGVVRSIDGRFFIAAEAVTAVRMLAGTAPADRVLFRPAPAIQRQPGMPIAVSSGVHVATLAALALATTLGLAKPQAHVPHDDRRDLQMVFLVTPGPGGGGGGGGMKERTPPPPAARKDASVLHSPVPKRKPPAHVDPPPIRRVDPPPRPPEPEVVAPVVAASNDPKDRVGIPWTPGPAAPQADSRGPGTGGGTGTGRGTGVGEGDGSGIGPGSGGGTGGGPYRPGSGIAAPTIIHEVKPDYTEEGRRRGIEGDVVVEIIVRSDGSVGSVKLLSGLGAGLDQRAIDAVKQWRFNPATRYGTPVDVIVQVAVEFKLR